MNPSRPRVGAEGLPCDEWSDDIECPLRGIGALVARVGDDEWIWYDDCFDSSRGGELAWFNRSDQAIPIRFFFNDARSQDGKDMYADNEGGIIGTLAIYSLR